MTLTFTLFSQEVEDFVLEVKVGSNTRFIDLHRLILDQCKYDEDRRQHFLICDEEWRVRNHVLLSDDGSKGYDEDIFLMGDSYIGDFIEEEGQKMAYVFDPAGKRIFLLEVTGIEFGDGTTKAKTTRRHGSAPVQTLEEESAVSVPAPQETLDMDPVDDADGFEEDELDLEGFEING